MMYYADVDADVNMINVMATAMASDATVFGDGAVSLDVGENTITVTVTAEDGTTMMTYTVMVTREAAPVGDDLLDRYDADDSGVIEKAELREAILHFIAGDIDTAQLREVIILYISRIKIDDKDKARGTPFASTTRPNECGIVEANGATNRTKGEKRCID